MKKKGTIMEEIGTAFMLQKDELFVFFIYKDYKLKYYYKEGDHIKHGTKRLKSDSSNRALEEEAKTILGTLSI